MFFSSVLPALSETDAFSFKSIDGGFLDLSNYRGKAILITNTASRCGFTSQYAELEKLHNTNLSNLNKIKDELQKEEKKILSKKNIISDDEYLKQIDLLKAKVNNYQNKQKKMLKELNDKRVAAKKELMDNLNLILTNFANDNDISYILNKKNVVIAKKDLDITDDIIILLNQKIKKIALK